MDLHGISAELRPLRVICERAVTRVAKAARQPAVHHGLLAAVQADAGTLIDQLPNPIEVGRSEWEFLVDMFGRGGRRKDSVHKLPVADNVGKHAVFPLSSAFCKFGALIAAWYAEL